MHGYSLLVTSDTWEHVLPSLYCIHSYTDQNIYRLWHNFHYRIFYHITSHSLHYIHTHPLTLTTLCWHCAIILFHFLTCSIQLNIQRSFSNLEWPPPRAYCSMVPLAVERPYWPKPSLMNVRLTSSLLRCNSLIKSWGVSLGLQI